MIGIGLPHLTKIGGEQSHVTKHSGGPDQDHRVVFQCYTEESQKRIGGCWKKGRN